MWLGGVIMWGLEIHSSMSFAMSRKSFSDDLFFFSTINNSEQETFYLGSPHMNIISKDNPEKAYYRAKALVRLLNGCLLLTDDLTFGFDDQICFINSNEVIQTFSYRKNDLQIAEYEELVNPFNTELVVKERAEQGYIRDCLILAKEDKLVRNTLLSLVLSKLDVLYFLINTYKIYENIMFDLGIPKKEKIYKREFQGNIPEGLRTYIDYFLLGDFTHYVNSEQGAGILSRHGDSDIQYNKAALDLGEIDWKIRNLINHWLREKMKVRFKYYYNNEYTPKNENFDLLTDDYFNF